MEASYQNVGMGSLTWLPRNCLAMSCQPWKSGCSLHGLAPQGFDSPVEANCGRGGHILLCLAPRACPVFARPNTEVGEQHPQLGSSEGV